MLNIMATSLFEPQQRDYLLALISDPTTVGPSHFLIRRAAEVTLVTGLMAANASLTFLQGHTL